VVSRIWCADDSEIFLNKASGEEVRFTITDAEGNAIVEKGVWKGKTRSRGWHTIEAFSSSGGVVSFVVEVTYTGTEGVTADEIHSQAPLRAIA
jgi:hypothetical protein